MGQSMIEWTINILGGRLKRMLSNVMVGLFAAVGAGAWVYSKVQHQTGGNTQNSLIVAGFAALGAFLAVVTFLQFFL